MPATTRKLIQCVPNFSEGRDVGLLEEIAAAIAATRVRLIDWSGDPDHNRSVFTYLGEPEDVISASLAAAAVAIARIDIGVHEGMHPRIGALDVLPFVPLSNASLSDCAAIARETATQLVARWNLPIFFYDAASSVGKSLPILRKTAFNELLPDLGPPVPHTTAGAVAVGAREPLIAFNINLRGGSIVAAKQISGELRGAFPGVVRALGLSLPSRSLFQVSMNIVKPNLIGLPTIIDFVSDRHEILECELIGAMPGYSAFGAVKDVLKLTALRPEQVLLETWMEEGGN